jgi:hypothetical protein
MGSGTNYKTFQNTNVIVIHRHSVHHGTIISHSAGAGARIFILGIWSKNISTTI